MRTIFALSLLAMAASVSYSDSSLTPRRDKALERVNECLRRNQDSSRQCKHLDQDVETLVEVYRGGDKSVLPTLFRFTYLTFTYLTDFYDEALLSDPDGFLSAMADLSAKEQQAVADGIAGKWFRLRDIDRVKTLRALLKNVPDTSPTKAVAEVSLKAVEAYTASLFVTYFPPRTFTGPAADFQVAWFSSDMYQLGETPLWPPSPDKEKTYRFTHLGAFTGRQAVTLSIVPDGSGQVKITVLQDPRNGLKDEHTFAVTEDQVSKFVGYLDRAQFWQLPTESQHGGADGAEWILEGVQDGNYHIVVRWCPNVYEHSPENAAFVEAARFLFQLAGAGSTLTGSC